MSECRAIREYVKARAAEVAATILGADKVKTQYPPSMGGEDFAFYQQVIPGAMYWLGVSNSEKGTVGMPHSRDYVADEGSIMVGARAMSAVLLDYLVRHAPSPGEGG